MLATGPAKRMPPVTLADLGIDGAASDVCFWCAGALDENRHGDHLLGVIERGRWNGLPEVVVPSHPRCNTGRRTDEGLRILAEDERVRARFGDLEGLLAAIRVRQDIVDEYNRLLREFADPIIESYQLFNERADAWWARACAENPGLSSGPTPGNA